MHCDKQERTQGTHTLLQGTNSKPEAHHQHTNHQAGMKEGLLCLHRLTHMRTVQLAHTHATRTPERKAMPSEDSSGTPPWATHISVSDLSHGFRRALSRSHRHASACAPPAPSGRPDHLRRPAGGWSRHAGLHNRHSDTWESGEPHKPSYASAGCACTPGDAPHKTSMPHHGVTP